MKVLILHQHFKTPEGGGALRSYYLAKALVERGIPVVVITAHNQRVYQKVNIEGIEVHYLPVAYDNKFGFTARSFSFLKFVWKAVRIAKALTNVTVCYAMSVPLTVGLAAIRLKRTRQIPFIFEVGDLWPDAAIQMGFVENYFFRRMLFSLERSIYNEADSLVALSPAIGKVIQGKVHGKTVSIIPNMADCDFYKPEIKEEALIEKWKTRGEFVVSYLGATGVANGLDYFLACANAARKAHLPIQFLLCGEGARLNRLKESAAGLNLQNLTFLGFQNRETIRQILNITDAVFVCYQHFPILETGSPNKFFDGLAAGKLIIINFGGWIREEIETARCGVFLDQNQPAEIVKKITPFLDSPALLQQYQQAARMLGEQKYSRKQLSRDFVDLVLSPRFQHHEAAQD